AVAVAVAAVRLEHVHDVPHVEVAHHQAPQAWIMVVLEELQGLEVHGYAPWIVTLIIFTGVRGRSRSSVGVPSILPTTSMPLVILPNTGCLLGPGVNQSRRALSTVLMKNCAPPELGWPVFAIDSVPGLFEIFCAGGCSSWMRPSGELPVPQRRSLGSFEYSHPNWIMKSLITRWKWSPS